MIFAGLCIYFNHHTTIISLFNMSLWECKHCGLYNHPIKNQCKACFFKSQNKIVKKQKRYESSLDVILKRPLIAELTVYGYIRKYEQFYINEIINMIYNFYFIKILNYKIQTIGNNEFGQQ
eukprot:301563_1